MTPEKAEKIRTHLHVFVLVGTVLITALLYAVWAVGIDRKHESTTRAADCTPDAKLVNPCRPWLGAAVGGYTTGGKTQFQFFNARLNNAGVLTNTGLNPTLTYKLDVPHVYHSPGQNLFNSTAIETLNDSTIYGSPSKPILINWKPGGSSWAATARGDNDASIRDAAAKVKALGSRKIMLALWHEPENNNVNAVGVSITGTCKTPTGSNGSAADYRAMWRHVVDVFKAQGVTNVVWVWNPMGYVASGSGGWACIENALYPGDDIVDWVMWDPYSDSGGAGSFYGSVQRFRGWLLNNSTSAHNYKSKPWGLAEHGSNAPQSDVIAYYQDGISTIGKNWSENKFPEIKLYAIFDTSNNGGTNGGLRVGYNNLGAIDTKEQAAYNEFAKAILTFNGGGTTTPPPGPAPDTTPPSVSITAPGNGSTVGGTVTITASASDNVGVTRVQLFVDGNTIIKDDTDGSDGWSSRWASTKVGNGAHTLKAVAYDAAGNTRTATSSIVVNNVGGVPAAPVINSFTANPTTVVVGNKTILSWSTSNTASCSIAPGGPTNTTATSWQTLALTSTGTITYTLTCKNSAGTSVSATRQVTVQPAPTPPTNVVLTANRTTIAAGGSVTFSWTSQNATSCELNPGAYAASGGSSSKTVSNIQTTTTYRVTCKNNAGATNSNSIKVTVTETPPPPAAPVIVRFVADPASLPAGGRSTLSWSASNVVADGCNLNPSPLTSVSPSSSWTTPALTSSVSYTLTCKNSAGQTTSKSVSVQVAATPVPTPPPAAPANQIGGTDEEQVTATSGQEVTNAQTATTVTRGNLLTLEPSTVTDPDKVRAIAKVEFYNGSKLVRTITKEPFALPSNALEPGIYTLTQRTYFADGSVSEKSQIVTIKASNTAALTDGARRAGVWILVAAIALGAGAFIVRRILERRAMERYASVSSASDPDMQGLVVGSGERSDRRR